MVFFSSPLVLAVCARAKWLVNVTGYICISSREWEYFLLCEREIFPNEMKCIVAMCNKDLKCVSLYIVVAHRYYCWFLTGVSLVRDIDWQFRFGVWLLFAAVVVAVAVSFPIRYAYAIELNKMLFKRIDTTQFRLKRNSDFVWAVENDV